MFVCLFFYKQSLSQPCLCSRGLPAVHSLVVCDWSGSHHFTHDEQLRWSFAVLVYPDRARLLGSRSVAGPPSLFRMCSTKQRAASSMFVFSWRRQHKSVGECTVLVESEISRPPRKLGGCVLFTMYDSRVNLFKCSLIPFDHLFGPPHNKWIALNSLL